MHAVFVLIQVFAPFAVLALNVDRGLERDIHDSPVAPTSDIFGDGTGLYEQLPQLGSVPVNRTEGSIRSGKREFNNLLESRQSNACVDPGYILVCPVTDPFPCCDPKFPICCHTSTCCPTGTFCVGQKTCCQTGTVACGEGCCPSGTVCCDTACCMTGYTCVSSGTCQQNSVPSTIAATSLQKTPTNTFTSTPSDGNTATNSIDSSNSNSSSNATVIGAAVGGVVGGIVLIGGGIAAWYFYNKAHATTAATTTTSNAGAAQPQGHGWTTGGAPGSPFVGQPLMTSTSMPFTPTGGAGTGFTAQHAYGTPGSPYPQPPGSPYQQPPTPSNGTDYNQPPVSQYPQSTYGAAAPPGSVSGPAPWAGGQAYGPSVGFVAPDTMDPGSRPSYYAGTPAPSNAGGSAYGGMAPEPMQPGQGAFGGFDSSTAYPQTPASPGPQVQTWVERSGGR